MGTCHGKQTRVELTKTKHYDAEFAAREKENAGVFVEERVVKKSHLTLYVRVVSICTTCFLIKKLFILSSHSCIYIILMILRINSEYFTNIKSLVFVTGAQYVSCET
jgi:hypothetical protein